MGSEMNAGPDVPGVINICRGEKGRDGGSQGRSKRRKEVGRKKGIQVIPSVPGNAKSHCNQRVLSLLINISEVLN